MSAPGPVIVARPQPFIGSSKTLDERLQPLIKQVLCAHPYNVLGRPDWPTNPAAEASSDLKEDGKGEGSLASTYFDCVDLSYAIVKLAKKLNPPICGMVVPEFVKTKLSHAAAAFEFHNPDDQHDQGYVVVDGGCQCTGTLVARRDGLGIRQRPAPLPELGETEGTLAIGWPLNTPYQYIIRNFINTYVPSETEPSTTTTTSTTTPSTTAPPIISSPSYPELMHSIFRRLDRKNPSKNTYAKARYGYFKMRPLEEPEAIIIRNNLESHIFIALAPTTLKHTQRTVEQMCIVLSKDKDKHLVTYAITLLNDTTTSFQPGIEPYEDMVHKLDLVLDEYGITNGMSTLLAHLNVRILKTQPKKPQAKKIDPKHVMTFPG